MFGWWVGIVSAIIVDGMAVSDNFAREEKLKSELRAAPAGEQEQLKKGHS